MIRDLLAALLGAHMPHVAFALGDPPGPVLTIAARHPAVGAVEVHEEGLGAIVQVGTITHRHFESFDPSLSDEDAAKAIAHNVCEFLHALLDDRVVVWTRGRGWGGCMPRGSGYEKEIPADARRFVWSGPLD